ncbi:hypothetical protein [Streptococcus oricebi]|uniref:Uncharacterized protein n=1 Tax=Streptococcus oricebi TaxID=1547447 RepID=A0ABS5B636_9STRE|nr:hypothetical protein [Streptococcus oricebi]MBP2624298.1 hypothetical protein [Streptococcus oricebi]
MERPDVEARKKKERQLFELEDDYRLGKKFFEQVQEETYADYLELSRFIDQEEDLRLELLHRNSDLSLGEVSFLRDLAGQRLEAREVYQARSRSLEQIEDDYDRSFKKECNQLEDEIERLGKTNDDN